MCFLFTRAWEIGRLKSHYRRSRDYDGMNSVLESAKRNHADWMRGTTQPTNWSQRFEIAKQSWPERWHLFERDLPIQADMEFLAEAVYQFYQNHLDKMIRKNELLWGDLCRMGFKRNEITGEREATRLLEQYSNWIMIQETHRSLQTHLRSFLSQRSTLHSRLH